MRRDLIHNRFTADSRNWRFAGSVNIRHDDAIGIIERAAKLVAQRFRARITMRLKHGQHSFAASRPRSFHRGANFGRVMGIIVNEQKAIALVLDFKSAARVLKFAKRGYNFFEWNPKLGRHCNYTKRIMDNVPARSIERRFAQFLPPTINAKF